MTDTQTGREAPEPGVFHHAVFGLLFFLGGLGARRQSVQQRRLLDCEIRESTTHSHQRNNAGRVRFIVSHQQPIPAFGKGHSSGVQTLVAPCPAAFFAAR